MAKMSQSEINESLQKEIQRLKDLHEVQEVMSRYFHWHTAGLHKECYDKLFAKKQPDVRAEIADWGRWEGPEAVKNLYYKVLTAAEGDRKGQMFVHSIDTPSIQIAGDGKTAKGVWFSPGHETAKVNGKLQAFWCWSYFGTDFIKEDGVWRIWHYHCYAMFRVPFEQSWVEFTSKPSVSTGEGPQIPEGAGPNKPFTYFNEYTPTSVRELVPAPPEPYETFDQAKAY
jgi:hypothetical protein